MTQPRLDTLGKNPSSGSGAPDAPVSPQIPTGTYEEYLRKVQDQITADREILNSKGVPNGFIAPELLFSDMFAEIIQKLIDGAVNGLKIKNPLPGMQDAVMEKISAAIASVVDKFVGNPEAGE